MGLALLSSGKSEEALAELGRSIELDPNQFQPRLLAGVILNESGQRGEAEASWEAALRIDPASTIALDWLAKARSQTANSRQLLIFSCQLPQDKELSLDLALAYSRAGFFDKAADTLSVALKKTPGDMHADRRLSYCLRASHRYQDATYLCEQPCNSIPTMPRQSYFTWGCLCCKGTTPKRVLSSQQILAAIPNTSTHFIFPESWRATNTNMPGRRHLKAAVNESEPLRRALQSWLGVLAPATE